MNTPSTNAQICTTVFYYLPPSPPATLFVFLSPAESPLRPQEMNYNRSAAFRCCSSRNRPTTSPRRQFWTRHQQSVAVQAVRE